MVAVLVGCGSRVSDRAPGSEPARIVSLAPSVTEALFAVGCGGKVVGVTDFCSHPPEVAELPRVGGFLDPNYEQLLLLEPDLVVLMHEHTGVKRFLKQNGIAYRQVDNRSVTSIAEGIRAVGSACGADRRADSLAASLMAAVQVAAGATGARPGVLLCVGRQDLGAGSIVQVFVAGGGSFYHELIGAAGGRNVLGDSSGAYPMVSVEAIMRMNPDIIIDVVPSLGSSTVDEVAADWDRLADVAAVSSDMVFCLTGSHVSIPGPRLTLLLSELKTTIAAYRAHAAG
jgi:iron complex transport system substrate-binding protein